LAIWRSARGAEDVQDSLALIYENRNGGEPKGEPSSRCMNCFLCGGKNCWETEKNNGRERADTLNMVEICFFSYLTPWENVFFDARHNGK